MKYTLEDFNYQKIEGSGKYNAGNKAHQDINYFLELDSIFIFNTMGNKISRFFDVERIKKILKTTDVLLQYPMYISHFYQNRLNYTRDSVCLVHDIQSLRWGKNEDLEWEINYLNQFSKVIVHTRQMKEWLIKHGCTSDLIVLKIFDYQTDTQYMDVTLAKNVNIAFAGNLNKSLFLKQIDQIEQESVCFKLFGGGDLSEYKLPSNVKYCGKFMPSDVPLELAECHFGLIWDGDSIESCTGTLGEYMKYNSPHKFSLYMAAGIPVIIWKQAALAEFVLEEKCGIVVDSLNEIGTIIEKMSLDEYDLMRNNARRISYRVRNGEYIKHAIK